MKPWETSAVEVVVVSGGAAVDGPHTQQLQGSPPVTGQRPTGCPT